jgi:hypothetical protein
MPLAGPIRAKRENEKRGEPDRDVYGGVLKGSIRFGTRRAAKIKSPSWKLFWGSLLAFRSRSVFIEASTIFHSSPLPFCHLLFGFMQYFITQIFFRLNYEPHTWLGP